jgi:glycosyltransferase involved in cell wall biosynthesis
MINAVMVTPNMTLGGAERWIVDLIKHTDPTRVRWSSLLVSGYGGADRLLTSELRSHCRMVTQDPAKLPTRSSGALPFHYEHFELSDISDFNQLVVRETEQADVVVTWGTPDMRLLFEDISIPRVLCAHTTEQEASLLPVTGVTHLVAVSEAALGYFRGRENASALPQRVIYNGIDTQRVSVKDPKVRQQMRTLWGLNDKKVVGYLGRQTREKNPFAAALAVHAAGPEYAAVFYGWGVSGKYANPRLVEWCRRFIGDRVLFSEPVPNVGSVLAGLDVFMLASVREAFSLGLIEAWIAGVPVVATPVGSIPELTREYGELVQLVPPCPSPVDLAEAVELAINNKDRTLKAQRLAVQKFTVEQMALNWMNYLESIVYDGK